MMFESHILNQYRTHNFAAIDPGTDTVGVSIFSFNHMTKEISLLHSITLTAAKHIHNNSEYESTVMTHGKLRARLTYIETSLLKLFKNFRVEALVAEEPFVGRNVSTFQTLVLSFEMIQRALLRHCPAIEFNSLSASKAKKLVGVSGNSGDKELMRKAVKSKLKHLIPSYIDLDKLSEHAIDSIAIGYAYSELELKTLITYM